ncbi:MAG: hypothetical protein ACSHYB_05690 [Roseibacillus sp.]
MNSRNPLISPTLWLAAGMGLVVGLVCLLLGAGSHFGEGLLAAYQGRGFPKMEAMGSSSPASLLALVIFTFGIVLALDGTPGTGRRVMLLLSGLVILAMASPVLALWGVFWNPFVLLISVFWAGVGAAVQGIQRDRAENLRIANERNVVQMRGPVSPSQRRKGP